VKNKIRYICIDGMEKTGKSSVFRQIYKSLKDKNKDLRKINGLNRDDIDKQSNILNDNTESIILKENSLMQMCYEKLTQRMPVSIIMLENSKEFREEHLINHQHGSVHFFLLPQDKPTADYIFNRINEDIPEYYYDLRNFIENINSTFLTQGLNVELILFDQNDKIFDIRDKILKIIEEKYQI
jgi:hypothetical protein